MASALSLWGVLFYFLWIVKDIRIPHLVGRQTWQVLPKNSVRGTALASSCSHALDGDWLLMCELTRLWPHLRWVNGQVSGCSLVASWDRKHTTVFKKVAPWDPAHTAVTLVHRICEQCDKSWHSSLKCKSTVGFQLCLPWKRKNHCIMSVKDIVSKGKLGHECCRGDVFWVQTCSLCLQDAQLYVSARPQNIVGLCSGRS